MKTVNFTEMKNGTKDEYLLLDEYEQDYIKGTADRILKFMKGLTQTLEGYKISRLYSFCEWDIGKENNEKNISILNNSTMR